MMAQLINARTLARRFRTIIGAELDPDELVRLAEERLIPALRLRGTDGRVFFVFDEKAVVTALADLAAHHHNHKAIAADVLVTAVSIGSRLGGSR